MEDKTGEDPPAPPPLSVCGSGAAQGTRRCERRARRRPRCRETKLAAHLGCRSHQWKMQTSSPSFSSGKTRFASASFLSEGLGLSLQGKVQAAALRVPVATSLREEQQSQNKNRRPSLKEIAQGKYF